MNPLRSITRRVLAIVGTVAAASLLPCCESYSPHADAVASQGGATSRAYESRPGLGTAAGYERYSHVDRAAFYRRSQSPDAIASFHYNDEEGAKAMAERLGGAARRTGLFDLADKRLRAGLVSTGDDAYPNYEAAGKHIVIGKTGMEYQIHLENRTAKRLEILVSVDSLNVLTGLPAGYSQHGYVLAPKQVANIDGFRKNNEQVKTFRFGTVADSKAAAKGLARNVGVVGLAVFEEDEAKAHAMLQKEQDKRQDADAFPAVLR